MALALIDDLITYWKSLSGNLNSGASEAELSEFESRYGVRLPPDLRQLFRTVNGCDSVGDEDLCLIEFHSLNDFLPIGSPSEVPHAAPSGYFSFADFCIFAHEYAVQLHPDTRTENSVAVFYDSEPTVVARSFSDFVTAYLAKDDAVLFPEWRR